MKARAAPATRMAGRPAAPPVAASAEEVATLAVAASRGDGPALRALCDRYWPLAAGVIAKMVSRRPAGVDVADVEQEAAEQLCEMIRQFDPSRRVNLTTYLQKGLKWRVANYLRAEARRAAHLPLAAAPLHQLADEAADSPSLGLDNPRLGRALRRLSPRQRAVIAGFYWRERTTEELSAELGVTPQAVTGLRRRAEGALRRELAGGA